jgi:hypothetical protein
MSDLWIERQEIGLVPAKSTTPFGEVAVITGHYFGTDPLLRTEADLMSQIRRIQYNDMMVKGYSDIMYNLGANPFRPKPLMLRGLQNRNAANGTTLGNRISPSVLFPFGPSMSGITHIPNWQDNLIESARIADDMIEYTFGKTLPWVGHKYWKATACPGEWMMALINAQFDERPLPPPAPQFTPDPDLRKRPIVGFNYVMWDGFNEDGYVRWVQDFLNRTSVEGCPVDGVWGWISHERLIKFQGYFAQQGFPCRPNGMTDLDTWATIHYIATIEGIV